VQSSVAADGRWRGLGRLGASLFLLVYTLAFRSSDVIEEAGFVRWASLGLVALLIVAGVLQLLPRFRWVRRFAVIALLVDATCIVGFLWLYAFDPGRSLFPLILFVILEGTLVGGLIGGLATWIGTTGAYVLGEAWVGATFDRGPSALTILLSATVGLVVAAVLGLLVRDLSNERRANATERESQQRRFQDIVWDLDAIVWEADARSMQFVFVSHPAERILGYPVQRWLNEPGFLGHLMHPDDRDRALEGYGETLRKGWHQELEYRMVTSGGTVIWIRDRVSPIRDADGRITQLRGVMLDITRRQKVEETLRDSFRLLFANNPQPMLTYDRDSLRFLAVNDAAVQLYGHTRDEFLQLSLTDICSPEEVDRLLLDMVRNRGALERSGEWRHRLKDGSQIDVNISSHTLELEGRKASLVLAEDITGRKRAEKQLREVEVRYRTLVEQIPAVTYVGALDEERTSIYMSPQVERLTGYAQSEFAANPQLWSTLVHSDDRERVTADAARAAETGEPFVCEYQLIRQGGEVIWVRDEAVVMLGEAGAPRFWQGVMVDVTDRKHAEREVAYLAYHDRLTGLANRATFQEVLDVALARARRQNLSVAVLYLDLDNFKLVNDSLGHSAGDELLRETAARLQADLREMDLVARVGGDEFVLLVPDLERTPSDERHEPATQAVLVVESVARRIQDSLRIPFVLEGTEVYVSASIGVSIFPLDAEDGSSLMKNADVAMYRSKRERPGGCMIFAKGTRSSRDDLSMATRLRKAVEGKHWILHYQPIVDMSKGAIMSVEGLVRWLDPQSGIIPPTEFIPMAEEMGLIGIIGDWVLSELCRQHQEWRNEGVHCDVGFNLSPRQLWEPTLVESILSRLDAHGVDPADVVVEITESAAMTDLERSQPILWDLHRHGLRLALDDFGMGYSSLSRLKQLPIDILKIDRFFIRDLPGDKDARSMVEAIIRLANSLEVQPLAEGIETEDQRRFLVEQGCTLGQGYLFSRPVTALEISAMLRGHRSLLSHRR
jgi:diguanylate cyclase (GGDEF)-like protein/PAS domain S-box-containing protein